MAKPVILVVDDESDVRSALVKHLRTNFECELHEAENGIKAMEYLNANPCDVIILDIKMPKKNGMAVIEETKAMNPNVDILVLSAYISQDVCDEALRLGAYDYAIKPLNLKAISIKVGHILQKRGQMVVKT